MTTSSPFKITQPGAAPNTCHEISDDWGQYFWEYSWTTAFTNDTVLEDNTYPVISREFYGDLAQIKLDFGDPDFQYIGQMTIVLTAKLPNGILSSLEFNLEVKPHPCN